MNVDGSRGKGRPKKRWVNCVTNDMLEKEMNDAMTANRGVLEGDEVLRRPGRKMMIGKSEAQEWDRIIIILLGHRQSHMGQDVIQLLGYQTDT